MNLNEGEVNELLRQLYARLEQIKLDALDEQTERGQRISNSISTLDTLLGTEEGEPNLDSIRGVQRFSDADIAAHPVLAVRLLLKGMEQLTVTVRDIASTLANQN